MTGSKDEIIPWLRSQIEYDEDLYPFASRSWEYEENFNEKEGRSAKRVILHPRRWSGRDAWWRHTLSSLRFFFGIGHDTANLRKLILRGKREFGWSAIRAAFIGGWNNHIDRSDALVNGDPIAWGEKALYVAEWDPERTDRETNFKRWLLDNHEPLEPFGWACSDCGEMWPCSTIRRLVDTYSHREGYQLVWGI